MSTLLLKKEKKKSHIANTLSIIYQASFDSNIDDKPHFCYNLTNHSVEIARFLGEPRNDNYFGRLL